MVGGLKRVVYLVMIVLEILTIAKLTIGKDSPAVIASNEISNIIVDYRDLSYKNPIEFSHRQSIKMTTPKNSIMFESQAQQSPIPWWSNLWESRRLINISLFEDSTIYSVYELSLDTQDLINNAKIKPNCEDIRIIWYNSTSQQNIDLDYALYNCNTISTTILFRSQKQESAGTIQEYYIYYQSNATQKSVNKSKVFFYFEDYFNETDWNYFTTDSDNSHYFGPTLLIGELANNHFWDPGDYAYHDRAVTIPKDMNLILMFLERDNIGVCNGGSDYTRKRFYFNGVKYLDQSWCPQEGDDANWHLRGYYIGSIAQGSSNIQQNMYTNKRHECIGSECQYLVDDISLREYTNHQIFIGEEENFDSCNIDLYPSDISFQKVDSQILISVFIYNKGNCGAKNIDINVLQSNNGDLINNQEMNVGNIYSGSSQYMEILWNLNAGDTVTIAVDPNNNIKESIKTNNIAEKEYTSLKSVFLEIDVPPKIATEVIIGFLKENLEDVYFVDNSDNAEIEVLVARHNPIMMWNFETQDKEGWGYNGNYVMLSDKKAFRPYAALVGSYKKDKLRVMINGNDVPGFVAGIKYFIKNQNIFMNAESQYLIDDQDTEAIALYDYMTEGMNRFFYKKDSSEFSQILNNALNDNMFSIENGNVSINGISYNLRHLSPTRTMQFRSFVDPDNYPIVLARGLWSNINDWQDFGEELANYGYDTWLIELTGGENTECDNCLDYTYQFLIENVLPEYVAEIKLRTGSSKIKYVGNSNGARVVLDSLSNGYLASSDIDTAVLVGVPGNFSELTYLTKIIKDSGETAISRLRGKNMNHTSFIRLTHELDSISGEIISARGLFSEKNKISINLFDTYNEWISSIGDPQPGEGVSIDYFTLIYGTNGLMFDNNNDYLVPILDSMYIFNVINSQHKVNEDVFIQHDLLAENKKVKEHIKKSLDKSLY